YDRYLGPLLFEPYAADLAARARKLAPKRILEIAAGTGIVTRALAQALPESEIVATDLNAAMLEHAARRIDAANVRWRPCNAQELPFGDGEFDLVVCQFGVMFFPERRRAYAEARRVLRPGGQYLFNVWDRIEANEVAALATSGVATVFPADPPRFLPRTPHGYYDLATIAEELAAGGFPRPRTETLEKRSRAPTARDVAIGICQGTPLRNEIEARDPAALGRATDAAAASIAARLGPGPIDGKIQAIVISAER